MQLTRDNVGEVETGLARHGADEELGRPLVALGRKGVRIGMAQRASASPGVLAETSTALPHRWFRKSQGAGTTTFGGGLPFYNYGGATLSIWRGNLKIGSTLNLSAAGATEFALWGPPNPANLGRITLSVPLQLVGSLVVTLGSGYLPDRGLQYDIVAGPVSGTFQSYTAPPISPYVFVNPVYRPNLVQLETTDPTPTFFTLKMDPQRGFTTEIHGIAGQRYVVAASTNFVDWLPLMTNLMPASTVWSFVDPDSHAMPYRFYRADFQP